MEEVVVHFLSLSLLSTTFLDMKKSLMFAMFLIFGHRLLVHEAIVSVTHLLIFNLNNVGMFMFEQSFYAQI